MRLPPQVLKQTLRYDIYHVSVANTIYQRLSEAAYKMSNSEDEMKAFQWVADVLDCIAELKASTGRVTDAEYRERIEKLFKKREAVKVEN